MKGVPTDIGIVHFVGIGGIGMSGIAEVMHNLGYQVQGSDIADSYVVDGLRKRGIKVMIGHSADNLGDAAVVVTSTAVKKGNPERDAALERRIPLVRRAEMLAELMRLKNTVAVAGTHGKTTTSSILGHLMYECNEKVTAFIGGISENYQSNLIQNGTDISVVEADEFDRSFLTLSPDFACITSMDADHLDIYNSEADLADAFKQFSKKIKPSGKLFIRKGLPLHGITYGVNEQADYNAINVRIENGSYQFDVQTPTELIENLTFHLPGTHNLSNAVAALAMAVEFGCSKERLKTALMGYKGVKRRFTYQIKTDDFVFIDDYAHHPTEINAVHQAVREMYPSQKVAVVFQPHLYSRTKDFVDDFAASLSQFDAAFLLEIYPARELPISGVTSSWLLEKIKSPVKKVISKSGITSEIKKLGHPIFITLGAGDIGVEVSVLKEKLSYAY